MGSIKNIIMIVIVLLLLLFGIKQQIDINTLTDSNKQLEEKLAEWRSKAEQLEYDANMSKEKQLEKKAREEYVDPDAQHFTNDYSN